MTTDTVTFALGGEVKIQELAKGISVLQRFITALTHTADVAWVVEDLHPGSAVATLRGIADDPEKVERVVNDYGDIGGLLERHEDLRYGRRVIQAAEAIRELARTVEYVRLETAENDYTIYGNGGVEKHKVTKSVGAITGRVQTLSNRGGLRFNLYDLVHDQAIGCYLVQGQEELMREAWGRRARVSGSISRQMPDGRPIAIRQILAVEILEDIAPGSYRDARGAVPWNVAGRLPEDIIRQLRDA